MFSNVFFQLSLDAFRGIIWSHVFSITNRNLRWPLNFTIIWMNKNGNGALTYSKELYTYRETLLFKIKINRTHIVWYGVRTASKMPRDFGTKLSLLIWFIPYELQWLTKGGCFSLCPEFIKMANFDLGTRNCDMIHQIEANEPRIIIELILTENFIQRALLSEQIHRKIKNLKIFTDDVIVSLVDRKWPESSNSVIRGLNKSILCDFIMGRLSLNTKTFGRFFFR